MSKRRFAARRKTPLFLLVRPFASFYVILRPFAAFCDCLILCVCGVPFLHFYIQVTNSEDMRGRTYRQRKRWDPDCRPQVFFDAHASAMHRDADRARCCCAPNETRTALAYRATRTPEARVQLLETMFSPCFQVSRCTIRPSQPLLEAMASLPASAAMISLKHVRNRAPQGVTLLAAVPQSAAKRLFSSAG